MKILTSKAWFIPLCIVVGLAVFGITYTISERGSNFVPQEPTDEEWEFETYFDKPPTLFEAINTGEIKWVRRLLEEGHDPNITRADGSTPLHSVIATSAISRNTFGMVKLLLSYGANPNQPDNDGYTPMNAASMINNESIMTIMLESGGNPLASHPNFVTPYEAALTQGHDDTIAAIESHTIFRPDNYESRKAVGVILRTLRELSHPNVGQDERRERINRTVHGVSDHLDVPDVNAFTEMLAKQAEARMENLDPSVLEALRETPVQR